MRQQPSFPIEGETSLDSRDYLWLCLASGLVLSIAFLLPVHPNDYWWYLRLGGEIWASGSIPQVDTWSSTQAGQPVVYHAWLAALALFGLERVGGIIAVVIARGLSLFAFYMFIFLSLRQERAGTRLSAGLTVLAVLVGCSNWGIRPQVFTFPLFGLALWILVSWHRNRDKWLWLLPVVTILWVNLHGSFPLAFLLAMAALIGGSGNRRRLAVVIGVMVLASLMNPRGTGAWLYFWGMLANPTVRQFSSEWKPASLDGWQSALLFSWLIAIVPLAAFANRRLSLSYWLWWFAFGWLALSGIRNIIWFSVILALVSAALIGPVLAKKPVIKEFQVNPLINLSSGTLLVLLTILLLPGLRQGWWSQAPPDLPPDTPVQAAQWLRKQSDLRGEMWNDLDFSSYLIYSLPQLPVWIDTRFEVYPQESWLQYQNIAAAGFGWEEWLDNQEIGLVLANNRNQPELIEGLRKQPGWCLRYQDSTATIFTRLTAGESCPQAVIGRASR